MKPVDRFLRYRRLFKGIAFWLGAGFCSMAAVAAPSESAHYTVKNGDTLLGLTSKFLIGPQAFQDLLKANALPDPSKIKPGWVLNVPIRLMRAVPLNAQLETYRGEVLVESNGRQMAATPGMAIREGFVLQTAANGFATVLLSNGSRMTLPTRSRVRILHMRRFLLTNSTDFDFMVDKGRSELTVTPATDPNNRFRLRTPIAVSAVRGTQFRIGYDDEHSPSLTEVIEGKVAVDGSASTESAMVPAGFGAAADAKGNVGTEKLLSPPVFVDAGRIQTRKLLRFDLEPVATAIGYHVQIARDETFGDMVAEVRASAASVTLGNIPDGRYFVRAMAVAPSGLEGLSQTYLMTRHVVPLSGSASPNGPSGYRFHWESDGDGAPLYRFQIFADGDPKTAIVDEPGLASQSFAVNDLTPGGYSWRVGMKRLEDGKMVEYWTDSERLTIPTAGR
jgi:hypothetical protein